MIGGITGLGQTIDFMVMNSSQEADNMINKIEELAAAGYVFTFDEIYVKWKVRQFHNKIKNNIEAERKIRGLYTRRKN
mgnify:CR=1 FL=1